MLTCSVKPALLFEPSPRKRQFLKHAPLHLPYFPSLPHSQNPYIQISNIPNGLRTLGKTTGGIPLRAKFQQKLDILPHRIAAKPGLFSAHEYGRLFTNPSRAVTRSQASQPNAVAPPRRP